MIVLPVRPRVAPLGGSGDAVDRSPSDALPLPSVAREPLNEALVRVEASLLIWLFR